MTTRSDLCNILRLAALALLLSCLCRGAPFHGARKLLSQPNGTRVPVLLYGDEYYQRVETPGGYPLVHDPDSTVICYGVLAPDGSDFLSTGIAYTDPALEAEPGFAGRLRAAGARAGARLRRGAVLEKVRAMQALLGVPAFDPGIAPAAGDEGTGAAALPPPSAPLSGDVRGLTLLIEFPDRAGTIPQSSVDAFCNAPGYSTGGNNGSVYDYFLDASSGTLQYTNHVTAYYCAQNNWGYYDDPAVTYGQRARELILEALTHLDATGFDFRTLSTDASGNILALNVFYAGNSGSIWAAGLWPHSSSTGAFLSDEGVRSGRYQITDMGTTLTLRTFCHENGHMICGWPDLYDYGYESVGIGHYGLMGYGGSDTNPVPPNAYYRYLKGWEQVTEITDALPGAVLEHTANTNTSYVHVNTAYTAESFFIESRRRTGRSAALPDEGLLVWHIDGNASNDNEQMTPTSHYRVSVEQADGLFHLEHKNNYGGAGDLFHAGYRDRFADDTLPNTRWWNGTASGLDLTAIGPVGSTMALTIGGAPVNQPPVAVDDVAGVTEDGSIVIGVLANDTDPEADPLSLAAVGLPGHGTATANPDGTVVYVPNPDFFGTDAFTYTVADTHGGTDSGTVTVTVVAAPDAPVANADNAATPEDTPTVVSVLTNDDDPDGDPLTVIGVTPPQNGTAAAAGTGVLYTPGPNFHGTDSFDYTVSDGTGRTDSATVTVTVTSVNDAPVANDDEASGPEDQPVTVAPLANDVDADKDILAIAALGQPAHGTASHADGVVTYTPEPDYAGSDAFTCTVTDGNGGTAEATVRITLTPVNDAPVATNDTAYGAMGESVTVEVLANDYDVDGDSLRVVSATVSAGAGTATASETSVTFEPATGFSGEASITYEISDGTEARGVGTLTVFVRDANAPALTLPDDIVVFYGASIDPRDTGEATAEDTEPGPVTVNHTDNPANPPPGPYILRRTWTARDSSGNEVSAVQKIIVITVTDAYPFEESTLSGTAEGSLAMVLDSDDAYQNLTEAVSGGKPSNRRSYLEHRWTLDVSPGDFVTFHVEAHRTANGENDDFSFEYSTDGVAYLPMVTVAAATDDDAPQGFELPGDTAGLVFVRAVDTDSTKGNSSPDTLSVDYLAVRSEDWPDGALPPSRAVNPSPTDGETGVPAPTVTVRWETPDAEPVTWDFYLGETPDTLAPAGSSNGISMQLEGLKHDTRYYWRVDAANEGGGTEGTLWSFRTIPDPNAPTVYVAEIVLELVADGRKELAVATVLVWDNNLNPVPGAIVTGTFSGDQSANVSAVTDASGFAVLSPPRGSKPPASVTFTVDSVSYPGHAYAPGSNVTTGESVP